jgi:DNA topoisomerase III
VSASGEVSPTEQFSMSGKRLISPGFLAVLGRILDEDVELPVFRIGERVSITKSSLREGKTKPPGFLTESELLTLMEKHGIGTDASMASHIENIATRNYVTLGPGRTLQPTPLGQALVHGFYAIDPELVLPQVRAAIEAECALIASGKVTKDEVLLHALDIFERKFRFFVSNVSEMDALFEARFTPLSETGRPFSRCGKCLRIMKLIEATPQRLFCPVCNVTYALPQGGLIKHLQGAECPLDGFQLVRFTLGNKSKELVSRCLRVITL